MELILLFLSMACGSAPIMLEVDPGEDLSICVEGPGGGQTVVLVPGLSGCAYGFRKLTPLLHAQGLRTIIIEPLGVGSSARPEDTDYTMTAQASRIGAVLDSLAVERAVFVGQGIGGAIVFRLAVENPRYLAGFVSIEAGSAEAAISPETKNSLRLAKAVAKLGGKNLLRDRYAENLREGSGDASWVDRRTVGRYFRGMGRDVSAALDAMTAMTEQTEPWAMTPRLPEVEVPVMVLVGTAPHAGALSPRDIDDLREGLQDVEFREVPGAGHFIYEEHPEAVADAVANMLAKISVVGFRSAGGAVLVPGNDSGADLVKPADGR